MRWAMCDASIRDKTRRNSLTAPYLWVVCSLAVIPAVIFWDNSIALGACIVLFAIGYSLIYARIVRFKVPRWLIIGTSARHGRGR